MKAEKTSITWRARLFLISGALASLTWAVTLYWWLVTYRVIDAPWVL